MIGSNQCSFYAKIHKQENKQSNTKPTKTTILKRQVGHQRRPFKAGIAFDDVRCSNEIFLREREKEILKRMPAIRRSIFKFIIRKDSPHDAKIRKGNHSWWSKTVNNCRLLYDKGCSHFPLSRLHCSCTSTCK